MHRCGRTGRAGKSGKAVTFFTGENHERSLAGEFMRVLRDVGAEIPQEMDRFPSTIKKKGEFRLWAGLICRTWVIRRLVQGHGGCSPSHQDYIRLEVGYLRSLLQGPDVLLALHQFLSRI